LRLARTCWPEARVVLWPLCDIRYSVASMLHAASPEVEVLYGVLRPDGRLDLSVEAAFEEAAIFVHASGGALMSARELVVWRGMDKPYAIWGVSMNKFDERDQELTAGAALCGLRDTDSLRRVHEGGVRQARFFPDTAFAFDLRDDRGANDYLAEVGLEPGFLVVIPRLRYTPYERMRPVRWSAERRGRVRDTNARCRTKDLAKLSRVISRWVEGSHRQVLLAPEMTYQISLCEELYAGLDERARSRTVVRDRFWLPDEAASVFHQAGAVLSMELHSPILALGAGTPAIHIRQPQDTCKGQMWRDIGLGDWIFEVDATSADEWADVVLAAVGDPAGSAERVQQAMDSVRTHHAEGLAALTA
jgi:polysaccharide pyruvyl transferase WcaK-like protein